MLSFQVGVFTKYLLEFFLDLNYTNLTGSEVHFQKKFQHIAKLAIFENNRLTIGEQKNAIENFYHLLLSEIRHV